MKILVTGGAGYIGSVLVPALLGAGHDVAVVDNLMWGQDTALAACCASPRFEFFRGDARDDLVVHPLVAWANAVIPLAALVGAPLCDRDPVGAVSTNADAVSLLVKAMSPGQWMVIPISNSGYGASPGEECTEETPMRPVSLYGRTKVEAEEIALEHGNAVSLRLATVFGMSPRMRLDLLVNDFVYRAITDRALVLFEPHFRRCFVHVRDVAGAFLHALRHFGDMRGRAFNVGLSSANLTKLELCQRVRHQVPDFHYVVAQSGSDPDKRDYVVSNARIEATGWRPQHSLDDGIKELVKGMRMLRGHAHRNA